MKPLIAGLQALGVARLAALAAVGLGTLAVLTVLMLNGGTQPMALLYGDLDLRDSGQIVDQLTRAHIPYHLAASGAEIMVPADQVARARVLAAEQGLPSGGSIGYEIFDHTDALGITEFQQRIDETRALEGELSRTIRAIDGVRAARVHVVLPRRAAFDRDQDTAQASVLLTMAGAARLDRQGVQAILNLVAAAVPGLKPQNIAIVDSTCWPAPASRSPRKPRRCPPTRSAGRPSSAWPARSRKCWRRPSAPDMSAPRPRCR
jgi:flagellar M-ring protein FliF